MIFILSIDPMYLSVAVLLISECPATLFYTGKSISVIKSRLFGLKCLCAIFLDCNEDISVNILNICQYYTLC